MSAVSKGTERRLLVHEGASPAAAPCIFLFIVVGIMVVVFVVVDIVVFASTSYQGSTI
jgi:hypothetical protein